MDKTSTGRNEMEGYPKWYASHVIGVLILQWKSAESTWRSVHSIVFGEIMNDRLQGSRIGIVGTVSFAYHSVPMMLPGKD